MIELLDPQKIDRIAYEEGVLQKIGNYSLLPEKRIGWNYCMDYTWLAMRCIGYLKPGMRVVDIGCGPGAIHGYLESEYGVDIIGIDLHRWERDYVDIVGDFCDPQIRKDNNFIDESIDCILSTSAFEHNSVRKHRELVNTCLRQLKKNGRLITTLTASPRWTRRTDDHWDLSRSRIEKIYGEEFKEFDYQRIWQHWHNHRELRDNYLRRYGKWSWKDPRFISVGADITKT